MRSRIVCRRRRPRRSRNRPSPAGADSGSSPWLTAMGRPDDPALPGLAKNLRQPHDRHRLRRDDVGQHRARPDRRQLIHVADQHQARPRRHRPQQLVHQHHIHHRRLVDDQQIEVERLIAVALEAADGRVEFEQAMNGLALRGRWFRASRLAARPVGAHRRTAQALGGEDFQDAADDAWSCRRRGRR